LHCRRATEPKKAGFPFEGTFGSDTSVLMSGVMFPYPLPRSDAALPQIGAKGQDLKSAALICVDVLHGQPRYRAFSSDVEVEQRDQDDAGDNRSHSDEGQCEAIGRCRRNIALQ